MSDLPARGTGEFDRIVGELIESPADFRAEALKERISTWLSTLAMLAVSTGIGWGLWTRGLFGDHGGPWGPYALIPAGAWLAFMVSISDAGRRPREVAKPPRPPALSPPGPTDPGNLHTKGPGAKS